jgi:hypothetical protein
MNRYIKSALASLALLLSLQVETSAQVANNINFLPMGPESWGTLTNWSDSGLGQRVPEGPFDDIANILAGGTAIVTGEYTDVTSPAGPGAINISAGTLQIQNSGVMTTVPSSIGTPNVDGHVAVNGTLNVQGGGKLTATNLSFGLTSKFDVDVTSATTSPVNVQAAQIANGASLLLDYSGLPSPTGKRTLITASTGFINGSFANVVATGIGSAQRVLVNAEQQGKQLTANVVNVPTVSINRQTGVATITNTHSTSISLDGLAFRSPLGAFDASDFTGLGAGWLTSASSSSTAVAQAYEGGSIGSPTASLAPGASVQVGGMGFFSTPYPTSFRQETEDVVVEITSPTIGATPAPAVVTYTGNKVVNNNIVLAIDTMGMASLRNVTNFSQEIEAYRISSTGSPLQPGTWSSLADQNADDGTWLESTQSGASALIEVQEGGTTRFSKADLYGLGKILNTGFTPSGITFEYLLAGEEAFTAGAVVFGPMPALPPDFGDYNDDGVVDAADYTVWRDNLGQSESGLLAGNGNGGVIDQSDYDLWKQNFGNVYTNSGAGAIATAAVPEPRAFTLVSLAIGIISVLGRRTS